MSIELQIRTSTLDTMVGRGLRARLRQFCPDPVGDTYVDHVDVSAGPARYTQVGAAVHMRVGLDVFLVRRDEVLAGGVPPGSQSPAGQAVLVLEIAVDGTELSLRCVDLEAPLPLPTRPVVAAVGVVLLFDLGAALGGLGLPEGAGAVVEHVDDVVAVRFEPGGPVARQVGDEDWCLFLDAVAVERLASADFRATLERYLTGPIVTPYWRPQGAKPHVEIGYLGKVPVPDPFTAAVDGTVWCDFGFLTPPYDTLRAAVVYSVHVDLGPLTPGSWESAAEIELTRRLDPAVFGGHRTGPTSFTIDRALPRLAAPGDVRFWYGSLTASAAGMTIGGSVFLGAAPRTDTVRIAKAWFGGSVELMVFCSQGALPDAERPRPSPDDHAVARAVLENGGRFGGVEIVTPGIAPYLTAPAPGTPGETFHLDLDLDPPTAARFTEPIQVIVRTARGVRLVDFGVPPRPVPAGDPNPVNALPQLIYVDDCLHEEPIPETVEDWQAWWEEQRQMIWNPDTDWGAFVQGARGFTTQLVTLGGLDPGEIVRFTTPVHRVQVTADQDGRAVIPALVRADARGGATLSRVNRRPLTGLIDTRDARVFLRRASVPGGLRNAIVSTSADSVTVAGDFDGRVDLHEVGPQGTRRLPGQSVPPPAPPPDNPLELRGLVTTYPIPGFPDAPVAIAELVDGERLVLDLGGRAPRVAGTFAGPIGRVDLADDWAITEATNQVSIFRQTRR